MNPYRERLQTPVKQRAFTLVEALVVVAILAILAIIALPSFMNNIAHGRAREQASEIASGLTWARQYALNSATIVKYTAAADCTWSATPTGSASSVHSGANGMPYGVTCQATNPQTLYFLADGSVIDNQTPPSVPVSSIVYTVQGGGISTVVTLSPSGLITLQ